MHARLYQPAKSAMSSGMAKTHGWVLELAPQGAQEVDPLMGWTGGGDTRQQVRLRFETKEAAMDYAKSKGLSVTVETPQKRQPNIRANGYAENFATNRRRVWTH